jgi:tRNA(adenine34) deaminase
MRFGDRVAVQSAGRPVMSSAMIRRRTLLARAAAVTMLLAGARPAVGRGDAATPPVPDRRWYEEAEAMRRLAESWGDQPYGAVVVLDERIVGEGPSRVVKHGDPSAHAEREAIRDAQRRLRRLDLQGAVLYSTSRPCGACEAAAAAAGVSRMYFGAMLNDAGVPRPRGASF